MTRLLKRLTQTAAARPALTVAVVLALAIAGGALALGLRPSAGIDTFVPSSSAAYRATVEQQRLFGADGIQVLVRAPLETMLAPAELRRLTELEACLGGHYDRFDAGLQAFEPVPAGEHAAYGAPGGPCAELMRSRAVAVVYGPGTFLNRAVAAINGDIQSALSSARGAESAAGAKAYKLATAAGLGRSRAQLAARQASALEARRQLAQLERLAGSSGIAETPSVTDAAFVRGIVLGSGAAGASKQPASRFQYLFPTADAALIQVRLRESLSAAAQARAIAAIRRAVALPGFALRSGSYTVTGQAVVTDELTGQITGAIATLLVIVLIVMAIVLIAIFRPGRSGADRDRSRPAGGTVGAALVALLPLAVALAAVGITFGLLAAVGARLTIASVAVLPVLIGLAVDYAVQFQARVAEARATGGGGPHSADGSGGDGRWAVTAAAATGAPTLATAALATAVAFLALLLSPVPMVGGFGLLLMAGVAVALAVALTGGAAALALVLGAGPPGRGRTVVGASMRGAGELVRAPARALSTGALRRGLAAPVAGLRASLRGARELLADGVARLRLRRVGNLPRQLVAASWRRPSLVLAVAGVLAAGGWAASGATPVQSDVTKLVPQDSQALRDLRSLERVTGVSGEIDLLVRGGDVATPATVGWMRSYQRALLAHFGYRSAAGCAHATLCPALSLTDLFTAGGPARSATGGPLTTARINSLLATVPGYFSRAVLTADRRAATLTFGLRLMPLSRQQRVIDYMRSRLHPPPGVTATLTGLPVLAAAANRSLSSNGRRAEMLIAGLLAVALVLLVVLRDVRRMVVALIPIVLATGWSALVVFAIGIPLNPMSATLGVLVIAISTEFSVLLAERFAQERAAGLAAGAALERTYRLTGTAVLTSGITATAGFAVLIASKIEMLRQFGIVTLVDLTVLLAGVLVVLPAVLAASERRRSGGARRHRRVEPGRERIPAG